MDSYDQKVEQILRRVLQTRKYHSLYPPTVQRIVRDCLNRYPGKKVEKEVRRKLHQIWGAYFLRPNFAKLQQQFQTDLTRGLDIKQALLPILALQSSTRERLTELEDFYPRIFQFLPEVSTLVEPACGLNALTYPWMKPDVSYLGYDVDQEQIEFINTIARLGNFSNRVRVELGDILVDEMRTADVAMFLKVLPILEHQQSGVSLAILKRQPASHLVVSFPTRSLSGRRKGMDIHYRRYFNDLVAAEKWEMHELVFPKELVFIVKKGNRSS